MPTTMPPLTIPEIKAADTDFNDYTLESATYLNDQGWSLDLGKCGCFLLDAYNPQKVVPKVGDTVRLYGKFGSRIYGIDINGNEVYWLTPAEREAERYVDIAKIDREKRERYARDREKNNEIVANLSEPLRKRIERFREEHLAKGDTEEILWEGYEIYCCQQADVIIGILRKKFDTTTETMTPKEALEWFRKLPYSEQVALGMDDGHSGNTFGGACGLALWVLEGRDV